LQSDALAGRVAELGSLGREVVIHSNLVYSCFPTRGRHKTPPRKVASVRDKNAADERAYQYQMSGRLIVLGLIFSITLFFYFGYMAVADNHNLMLFRVINAGPILSRLVWVLFSGLGFHLGFIYIINAVWTATGGRKIIVSNGTVEIPSWLSRVPHLLPFQQIGLLQLKSYGGRVQCVGLNSKGKKLFCVDSWQFGTIEDFADFVSQMQLRGGIAVKQ